MVPPVVVVMAPAMVVVARPPVMVMAPVVMMVTRAPVVVVAVMVVMPPVLHGLHQRGFGGTDIGRGNRQRSRPRGSQLN